MQETRWSKTGTFDIATHTVFRCSNTELGVAIVNQTIKQNVTDFKSVNNRICLLRIKTKSFNMIVIKYGHTETENKDEETKNDL